MIAVATLTRSPQEKENRMSDPQTQEPDPDITRDPDDTPKENPSGSAAGDGTADTASGGAPE